ncbi:MAG TPA: hypothetical protein VLT61_03530, partial [Anaeromyxobacteraceae bacterium]|nr:hypothetical protein [Anaeromyxobacteraceae bacterium]
MEITERERLIAQLRAADRATSIAHVVADVFSELADPISQLVGNVEFALMQLEAVAPPGERPPDQERVGECIEALREARAGGDVLREAAHRLRSYLRAGQERQDVDVAEALRAAAAVTEADLRGRARLEVVLETLPRVRGG